MLALSRKSCPLLHWVVLMRRHSEKRNLFMNCNFVGLLFNQWRFKSVCVLIQFYKKYGNSPINLIKIRGPQKVNYCWSNPSKLSVSSIIIIVEASIISEYLFEFFDCKVYFISGVEMRKRKSNRFVTCLCIEFSEYPWLANRSRITGRATRGTNAS